MHQVKQKNNKLKKKEKFSILYFLLNNFSFFYFPIQPLFTKIPYNEGDFLRVYFFQNILFINFKQRKL